MKKFLAVTLFSLYALKGWGGIFLDGEFLYWRASTRNLDYALHVNTTIADTTLTGSGVQKNVDFSWDPGVRAALGYASACNPLSISLIGTYLHSKASGSDTASTTSGNEFLHTLWFQSFTGFRAGSAQADWTLDFGTLDLIASYSFTPWECILLTPHMGIRSLFIQQKYLINYDDLTFSTMMLAPLSFPHADVDLFSKYLAIGLNLGSTLSIPLGSHFSIDALILGSLVYGKSRVKESINGAFPIPAVPDPILISTHLTLPHRENHVRANLETQGGITYKNAFNSCTFELSLAYFFGIWFDQNDFYNFIFTTTNIVNIELQDNLSTIDERHGNLELQGLVARAALTF